MDREKLLHLLILFFFFFFSSRRRHTSFSRDWSSDVCSSDLNQLFIGPYAIDENRNVRAIPYTLIPGRPTGTARHLTDPANKVYHGTMEEGFYEIDVNTLEAKLLYVDLNVTNRKPKEQQNEGPLANLDGAHGKGLYSGQGVLVYSNNGETGREAQERFDVE